MNAPQHDEAERMLLGEMMQSPAAADQGARLVDAESFFNPMHADVWRAIKAQLKAEQPVEPMMVVQRLTAMGSNAAQLVPGIYTAGGMPASMPHYAALINDAARRREVIAIGERLIQQASGPLDPGDSDSVLEFFARQSILLDELVEGTDDGAQVPGLQTMDEFASRPEDPTSWIVPDLIERGDVVMLLAAEGAGKRLRVDEPIPTPDGWTTMGALHPGDRVFAADGSQCSVLAVSPVDPYPDAWTVVFDDGTEIEADAEHQWVTVDYRSRQRDHEMEVHTTAQIRESLKVRDGHVVNHAVPVAGALEMPDAELPISPYTFGLWLGDGSSRQALVTLNRDDAPELEAFIEADGYQHHRVDSSNKPGSVGVRIEGLQVELRAHALLGSKSLPDAYLRGSIRQRTELLAGLLDSDGWIDSRGDSNGRGSGSSPVELTLTCKQLIPSVVELIRSLGIKVSVSESDAVLDGRTVGRRWRMTFQSPFNPFRLSRKAARWVEPRTRRSRYRYIVDVRRVEPTPMRCIMVDSSDHTYLAGRRMVPTHNSVLSRMMCIAIAAGVHPFKPNVRIPPQRTLLIDLENAAGTVARDAKAQLDHVGHLTSGDFDTDNAWLWHYPRGLNLRKPKDARLLERVVARVQPSFIAFGSLYKAYQQGSDSYEAAAQEVREVLDRIRDRHKVAWWIEHHMPKGDGVTRPNTPYGASEWLKWSGYGRILEKVTPGLFALRMFRGDRESGREWPAGLARGGTLRWSAVWDQQEIDYEIQQAKLEARRGK